MEDRPKRIKAEVLPYDTCDVSVLLDELASRGFVIRYEAGGIKLLQVVNFCKHQDPHYKEKASAYPPPSGMQDSGVTPGGVPEKTRQEVFDRDGRACVECNSREDLSLDHIIPRSKGGSHDVSNLRTLCRRCNSAKNNREARAEVVQSLANDRSIIGQSTGGLVPSDSLIPDSLGKSKALVPDESATTQTIADCPHAEIIALYHEKLPMLRRVREWSDKRKALLRTRWREKPERQELAWWAEFFAYVSTCPLLIGNHNSTTNPGWQADLEWLLTAGNFVKVIEGKYQPLQGAT